MEKNRFTKLFVKTLLASALAITFIPMQNVHAAETDVTASYEDAVNSIIIPRYEADGTKTNQKVSDYLKTHLDTKNLTAKKDDDHQTLTVDIQLKDVYLASEYLNGIHKQNKLF